MSLLGRSLGLAGSVAAWSCPAQISAVQGVAGHKFPGADDLLPVSHSVCGIPPLPGRKAIPCDMLSHFGIHIVAMETLLISVGQKLRSIDTHVLDF